MDTTSIRAAWQERLDAIEALYDTKRGINMRFDPDEFLAVVAEGCPPKLNRVARGMQDRSPTHVLLTPKQLKALLDYERRTETNHRPADVSRQPEADVANQVDAGLDRSGADSDPD